jgi:hypothetical protein
VRQLKGEKLQEQKLKLNVLAKFVKLLTAIKSGDCNYDGQKCICVYSNLAQCEARVDFGHGCVLYIICYMVGDL